MLGIGTVTGPDAQPGAAGAPPGWYPDPAGAPAWRHWEGSSWSDSTMPYAPPAPSSHALAVEASSWRFLHAVAPWAIGVQAVGLVLLAAESSTYGVLRRWFRDALRADAHHRPLPPLPSNSIGSTSAVGAIAHFAVLALSVAGIVGWLWFSVAALRVARESRYPHGHNPVLTSVVFFIPIAGPLVAWSASKACLPKGHEARGTLGFGWLLVVVGEIAWLALYGVVLGTSASAPAWIVAIVGSVAWVAAAFELPGALGAIAEDHASLGVRPGAAYS